MTREEEELFKRAYNGDKTLLNDPRVSKVKEDLYDNTPLHLLALARIKEALSHPDVSKVKNKYDDTPLHWLSRAGLKEVLNHPDVAKVKNRWNNTPLHLIADAGIKEVALHPNAKDEDLRNENSKTPYDIIVKYIDELIKNS